VRGSLAHEALERFDADPEAELLAAATRYEVELTPDELADLMSLVTGYATTELSRRVAEATRVKREYQFSFPLGAALLTGVVDVLATEDDGHTLVVDYKSDHVEPDADLEALVERDYGVQRRAYAVAALHEGAPSVEVAYAFLERPHQTVATLFDRTDVDRLTSELTELASGALGGEFPVAEEPHIGLCAGCPGRSALCIHDETLTGRELPETEGA
jgi:ATP-dependent exoDNAse (exonuclease V) beta subunit